MSEVRQWLDGLGLGDYAEAFDDHAIDIDVLADLTDSDLEKIGVRLGHRKKLLKAIAMLSVVPAAPAAPREAERRQITVMFCDLVGSTALSEQLDPEDLRALMQAYQQAAGAVIERYGGHVAQYLGDGLMTYFGWPQAHEDDAERAVRAGLDIVEAVKAVEVPEPLAVRIGIATGPVVVGETGAGDASVPKLAVGETPNLAARLQGLAGADEVVIGPSTRRLIGETFELDDLGDQTLKGIVEPVRARRVTGIAVTEGRFEAQHQHLTPLVGREAEMAMVLARWKQAKAGEGQLIVLSGEPGIGKSRITQALRERLADEPHTRLRHQCSPYHTNSALHPVIEQLERAAGFARDDTPDQKLDKLEALLEASPSPKPSPARGEGFPMERERPTEPYLESPSPLAGEGRGEGAKKMDDKPVARTRALLASLLSLPTDRYPPLAMSPQKQKEETLKALADQIAKLAMARPLLLVFEDAHWIDPTSQEALDLIVPSLAAHKVLAVITLRPEYTPPWFGQAHVTPLALTRLGRADAAAMVARVSNTPLDDTILDQIVAKTDGVPLFVEELTKTVIESGAETANAIPETLQDSLMARLDRLSTVKEVAQIGACIGREFSHALIVEVSDLGNVELIDALQQLSASELVFCTGQPPNATYIFKHALVQDVAYGSLLKSRRQQLHTAIADILERLFTKLVAAEPEQAARHYTAAGQSDHALPHWLAAGQIALARFANEEASAYLVNGLDCLAMLPESRDRDETELNFQTLLGFALINYRGYGAPETGRAYSRASELCQSLGNSERLAPILLGLWTYYIARSEFGAAGEMVDRLFVVAQESNDTGSLLVGHAFGCATSLFLGDATTSLDHAEKGIALYDPDTHADLAKRFGQDVGPLCADWGSWALWLLGYPCRAAKGNRRSLVLAEATDHPLSYATVLSHAAIYDWLRRDAKAAKDHAEAAMALSQEVGIPFRYIEGLMTMGWALSEGGAIQHGMPMIREGIEKWRAIDASRAMPLWLTMLAEAESRAGDTDKALATLEEAFAALERTEERVWEPEVVRLKGVFLLDNDATCLGEAMTCFEKSINVARDQSAKSWELRAATSLANLWLTQGKTREAHDLLFPIYDWFTEGFDTVDLKEAKVLLAQLN